MRQSELFSKTIKNLPEGEESRNAQLLIKGGFINKSSAGVYSILPLGFRVLSKINQIIREEMNAIGGEEMLMPALVHRKYWQQSERWDVDVIYKTGESAKTEKDFQYGLGWTHEEVISAIAKHFVNSYKDLPKAVYQIQMKFRAEARPQAGILRGREFLMKDLYSFHADKKDLDNYYEKVIGAYKKIFDRLGLKTKVTEASGGAFTKEYTHEFQVLNPAGEDTVYYCDNCDWSQNKEIAQAKSAPSSEDCGNANAPGRIERGDKCPACKKDNVKIGRGIEVGNVFKLGIKFSEAFHLFYLDKNSVRHPVIMGSYGIGPTRVMGALVEEYNDEKGIIWPDSAAPFTVHLVTLGDSEKVKKEADNVYKILGGLVGESEVLYDERNLSAGEKLNDVDLLGIPFRLVISDKTIKENKIEVKKRSEKGVKLIAAGQLENLLNIEK